MSSTKYHSPYANRSSDAPAADCQYNPEIPLAIGNSHIGLTAQFIRSSTQKYKLGRLINTGGPKYPHTKLKILRCCDKEESASKITAQTRKAGILKENMRNDQEWCTSRSKKAEPDVTKCFDEILAVSRSTHGFGGTKTGRLPLAISANPFKFSFFGWLWGN